MRDCRRGFTLVEVLIALMIGSLVVLLTHELFRSVTEGAQRLERGRVALERQRLGDRWLAAALLSLETGDLAGSFEGHPDNVRFATWLLQPGGWMELDHVRLSVIDTDLVAETAGGRMILQTGVERVGFDYLLEPGADSRWVQDWVSPVSAPLAVRIRLTLLADRSDRPIARPPDRLMVDTLLLLIKGRG